MASSNPYSVSDQKLILSKPVHSGSYSSSLMLLKDYLLDDLSSCSSNGFKSFPRRPCCTTVSLLIDKDLHLKPRQSATTKRVLQLKRSRSANVASTTLSVLQKVSEAVIRAVKLLPLPSAKSSDSSALFVQSKTKKPLLPRSFSRKLLKKRFWKKAISEEEKEEGGDGIRQWRLFLDFLEERDKPSDHNTQPKLSKVVVVGNRVSTSSSGRSTDSNSESWGESEFTSGILQSSSGHSESLIDNDVMETGDDDVILNKVSNIVGATVGQVSTEALTTTKEWPNDEKEQFSPVSVLDSPFDDEEDIDVASPFFHSELSRLEGTKTKLMQKIRRFEKKLDFLEPVDLEKRIASSELAQGRDESSFEPCLLPRKSASDDENNCKNLINEITGRNGVEERARDLHSVFIHRISVSNYSWVMKADNDNLLYDFFKHSTVREDVNEQECWTVAEEWLAGNPKEMYLGWEVIEGRKTYLKDREKSAQWKKPWDAEKQEMGLDLEVDVLSSLIDELILEL